MNSTSLKRVRLANAGVPARYLEASIEDFGDEYNVVPSRERGGVFLHGPTGCGKTHLACAMLRHLGGPRFVTTPMLMAEIRASFNSRRGESEMDVIERYSRYGALVIDDLGAENRSDFTLSTIYAVISNRINDELFTIVTSNLNLRELDELEPRIASRLGGLHVIQMKDIDYRIQGAPKRDERSAS